MTRSFPYKLHLMEDHYNGDSVYVDNNCAYYLKDDTNKFTLLHFAVITFHGRVITFCENGITFRVVITSCVNCITLHIAAIITS